MEKIAWKFDGNELKLEQPLPAEGRRIFKVPDMKPEITLRRGLTKEVLENAADETSFEGLLESDDENTSPTVDVESFSIDEASPEEAHTPDDAAPIFHIEEAPLMEKTKDLESVRLKNDIRSLVKHFDKLVLNFENPLLIRADLEHQACEALGVMGDRYSEPLKKYYDTLLTYTRTLVALFKKDHDDVLADSSKDLSETFVQELHYFMKHMDTGAKSLEKILSSHPNYPQFKKSYEEQLDEGFIGAETPGDDISGEVQENVQHALELAGLGSFLRLLETERRPKAISDAFVQQAYINLKHLQDGISGQALPAMNHFRTARDPNGEPFGTFNRLLFHLSALNRSMSSMDLVNTYHSFLSFPESVANGTLALRRSS